MKISTIVFVLILIICVKVTILITPLVKGAPFLIGYAVLLIILRIVYPYIGWDKSYAVILFLTTGGARVVDGLANGMIKFLYLILLMFFGTMILVYDPKDDEKSHFRGRYDGYGGYSGGCSSGCGRS